MNARELLQEWKERCNRLPRTAEEDDYQTILRALSLLADAEANDGTTPETDAARLTINQRRMIAEGRGVVSEMVEASVARRLERKCNGLARSCADALDKLAAANVKIAEQQAKIDALMLEYCPDAMTTEQLAEWARHQKASGSSGELP